MMAPALELADIFRIHGPAYLAAFGDSLSAEQKRALREISVCQTAALGGRVEQCDHCGHRKIFYCSCRNRHCPKCRSAARAAWLERRGAELLPVEYFHVVFTLPQPLAPLALQNQRVLYAILFRAASETLLQMGADPKHLGARIVFWQCSIPGDRTLSIIRTSIASFPVAESVPTVGLLVAGNSCFP